MHHDFVWNTVAYAQRTLKLTRDDVTIAAPKLFFGYALASNMLFPFSVGGSCVLLPQRVKPADYFNLIERYRATQFVTVPTTIAKMLDVPSGPRPCPPCTRSSTRARPSPRAYRRWRDPATPRSTTASGPPRCSTCTSPTAPVT